jgi:type I restriction enzyme R subunit
VQKFGAAEVTEQQVEEVTSGLKDDACRPFDLASVRELLKIIKQKADIIIDEVTADEITEASYDLRQAEQRVKTFHEFIEHNKDELLALQILYSQPYVRRHLTYASIQELATRLFDPPQNLTAADLWQAYKRLEASLVRGVPSDRMLTDIISLVRFATGQADVLEPYAARVEQKFNLWIGRQIKAGRTFTNEQMGWLKAIKDYLAANVEIAESDLMRDHPFADWGGVVAARNVFGVALDGILQELNEVLVA